MQSTLPVAEGLHYINRSYPSRWVTFEIHTPCVGNRDSILHKGCSEFKCNSRILSGQQVFEFVLSCDILTSWIKLLILTPCSLSASVNILTWSICLCFYLDAPDTMHLNGHIDILSIKWAYRDFVYRMNWYYKTLKQSSEAYWLCMTELHIVYMMFS